MMTDNIAELIENLKSETYLESETTLDLVKLDELAVYDLLLAATQKNTDSICHNGARGWSYVYSSHLSMKPQHLLYSKMLSRYDKG